MVCAADVHRFVGDQAVTTHSGVGMVVIFACADDHLAVFGGLLNGLCLRGAGLRARARKDRVMSTASLEKRADGVAVLRLDTADSPVNVLSRELFDELGPILREIDDDATIQACVLAFS